MKRPKNNALYWLFKALSVVVACAFPILAIIERYPIWVESHGKTSSFGTGGILIIFVVLFIFRKSVFGFFREKLRLRHAPPLLGWLIPIAIGYAILYASKYVSDIISVFWMGFIGSAIGMALTFIAENFLRKKEKDNG